MAYIYKIINDINNKVYIGKTNFSIEKRFKEHCSDAAKHRKERRPLYNAMNKYGIEHFQIQLIEETDDPINREIYWIKYYNSYHNGYNATLGGDGRHYLNYKKILKLYDTTSLSQKEIAEQCNCSKDSVHNIVEQYRDNVNWRVRDGQSPNLLCQPIAVKCVETQQVFSSCGQASRWLVSNNYIQSYNYGRTRIARIIKEELLHYTVGGFHWEQTNKH